MTFWLALSLAYAGITIDPAPQVEQESALVVLKANETPHAGATVRAFLHPGLPEEEEFAIGVTDARGRVLWTPQASGRVQVQAGAQTLDLLVVYPTPPTGPLALLALAALAGLAAVGRSLTTPS